MSYPKSQIGNAQAAAPGLPLGLPPPEPNLLRQQWRRSLEAQLNRIGVQLAQPDEAIDAALVRQMLLELCASLRSESAVAQGSDYHWALRGLTQIYAQGLGPKAREPITATAAAYAEVIETITREYPAQDYSEAVGQLFRYMNRLFRKKQSGWKAIYEHILSIPDSVEAKQVLNRAFFFEIQEWADAGVDNLFAIRADLCHKMRDLKSRIQGIDQRITRIANETNQTEQADKALARNFNVIDLARVRRSRLIASLQRKRKILRDQQEDEESIAALIESDIREFEEKLQNTRRAYFLRPV